MSYLQYNIYGIGKEVWGLYKMNNQYGYNGIPNSIDNRINNLEMQLNNRGYSNQVNDSQYTYNGMYNPMYNNGNMTNGMMNNGYNNRFNNQNYSVINGKNVNSIDEVKSDIIPLDGTVSVYPDILNGKIYTKQLNLENGMTVVRTYVLNNDKKEDNDDIIKMVLELEKKLNDHINGGIKDEL